MRALAIGLALSFAAGPAAAQQERSAPLPVQARGAMLTLSLALSRTTAGSADLLRFSDLSARLSMTEGPVSQTDVAAYARLAAQLVEASVAAGAPASEAAAPLAKIRETLFDRLAPDDSERLDQAYRRLSEVRSASTLERARGLARALAARKDEDGAGPAAGPMRPAIEWWTVGTRRWDSTTELVKAHSQAGAAGGLAVYHFRHAPVARVSRLAGLSGAALAVGAAAALFAAIAALLSWTVLPGTVAVTVSRVLPAGFRFMVLVIGAFVAANGWKSGIQTASLAQREGIGLSGTLRIEQDALGRKVLFIPARPNAVPVDLASHAQAPAAAPPAPERQSDYVIAGAIVFLLSLAAAFVPLFLGDVLVGLLAAKRHAALGRRLGLPHLLAKAAGVGLVLIAQALLLIAVSDGVIIALGLAAVSGGLWGWAVLPRLRAAEAAEEAEKGQWWTRKRPR